LRFDPASETRVSVAIDNSLNDGAYKDSSLAYQPYRDNNWQNSNQILAFVSSNLVYNQRAISDANPLREPVVMVGDISAMPEGVKYDEVALKDILTKDGPFDAFLQSISIEES
jgi:hypothetical protein